MKIEQKPRFNRFFKKLPVDQKSKVENVIRFISENPEIGISKIGNLGGIQVYKFKLNKQPVLLAYEWRSSRKILTILALGSHENFYRNLDR